MRLKFTSRRAQKQEETRWYRTHGIPLLALNFMHAQQLSAILQNIKQDGSHGPQAKARNKVGDVLADDPRPTEQ